MKKIVFITILVCFIVSVVLFCVNNNCDNKLDKLEKTYNKTNQIEDLYILCREMEFDEYEKIIKYYPLLIKSDELVGFIEKDSYWETELTKMTPSQIKNIFVLSYLDSVLTMNGEIQFNSAFDEFCNHLDFGEKDNDLPILVYLNIFFFNETCVYESGLDKEKTGIYLETLSRFVNSSTLTEKQKDFCNLFIYTWFVEIGDTTSSENQRDFVSKPFTSTHFLENKIDITNEYILGYSNSDDAFLLGKKSYLDKILIFVGYDIEAYSYYNGYICVLQNKEGQTRYYIINTSNDEVSGPLNKFIYEEKCKELDLTFELSKIRQGTDD